MTAKTRCPKCHCLVNEKNLNRHIRKVHRTEITSTTTVPREISARNRRINARKRIRIRKNKPLMISNITPNSDQDSGDKVICSICRGDGGAKGECYKCGGSGWMVSKTNTSIGTVTVHVTARKIMKHDRPCSVNRDLDGRFSSEPMYDRYDDESGPDDKYNS